SGDAQRCVGGTRAGRSCLGHEPQPTLSNVELFGNGSKSLSSLRTIGPRLSWLVLGVAILLSGAVLMSGVTAESAANATSNLPPDAESARAAALQDELATAQYTPAIVVFDRDD